MISNSFAHTWTLLLAHLLAPAVRSLLLACFAALVLGLLRVRSVATRLLVWTAVLYAALAMPLLGFVLPSVSLHIPASAARLISKRFDPAIAPASAVKSAELGRTISAPVIAQPGPGSARESSRILPAHHRVRTPLYATLVPANGSSLADSAAAPSSTAGMISQPAVVNARQSFSWASILPAIYLSVCALFIARLFLGIFFGRRLVRFARPIGDAEVIRWIALRAREADLTVAPRLAESESITVPVTLGILRPVILFPADWRDWDAAVLRAVIVHELSHVIRRDALTQRLSLLHRAVFWFSPLSWWLHRRLADVAEEASDEAALVSGADRASYAEMLLGFFAALQGSPRRVYWQGVSMAKAGQAERRVERILAWKGNVGIRMNKFVAIAMIFAGVPAVLFAAAARPSVAGVPNAVISATGSPHALTNDEPAQTGYQSANPEPASIPSPKPVRPVDPASAAPPAPPAVAGPMAPPALPSAASEPMPAAAPKPTPQSEPAPAVPPIPPTPAAVSKLPPQVQVNIDGLMGKERLRQLQQEIKQEVMDNQQQLKAVTSAEIVKIIETQLKDLQVSPKIQIDVSSLPQTVPLTRVKISTGGFNDRYVIVSGDSPIFMSGDSQDVEHATSLRGKINGDFIWFQRDEKSYIIRDQATVNRAKELFKPQQDLGEKQQALGKQQQALGDQQRDLGKKMQSVQVQLPDMTADMQKLEADMKQLSAGGTEQQLGDLQREIGQLQRKVGQVQAQAGDQMRQSAEPMHALGEQQRQLGEQQRALGEQQREAARQARDQMKQLLDDAIAHGTAQPE